MAALCGRIARVVQRPALRNVYVWQPLSSDQTSSGVLRRRTTTKKSITSPRPRASNADERHGLRHQTSHGPAGWPQVITRAGGRASGAGGFSKAAAAPVPRRWIVNKEIGVSSAAAHLVLSRARCRPPRRCGACCCIPQCDVSVSCDVDTEYNTIHCLRPLSSRLFAN